MKASAFKKIYASLIIAILFIENANSQIIYTNVNPDQTCTSLCSYSIDLNNDGIIDFTLHHVVSNGPCLCGGYAVSNSVYITLNSGNAVVSNGSPLALNFGYPIDNSNTFSTSINQTLAGTGQSCIGGCHGVPRGIWSGVTNHYLGLRLQIGSNSFYGWANLDVGSSGSNFTIKEYAYNSTPNQSILAGQTTCAITKCSCTTCGYIYCR